jgi:hypothetical protein
MHNISYSKTPSLSLQYAMNISKTGFQSTEERLRVLGDWLNGMSSEEDQGKGSSQYMFTRAQTHADSYYIVLDPLVSHRNSNYQLNGDKFGKASLKGTSPFDTGGMLQSGSGDEVMVKNGASLMSDFAAIVVPNSAERDALIKLYKDMGVDELRGLPIEQRIVISGSDAQKALKESWKRLIENQKKGIMPWHTL